MQVLEGASVVMLRGRRPRVGSVEGPCQCRPRPWRDDDIEPLVEVYRDPVLRRWTTHPVESIEDALRWRENRGA
jgi:hypothetical protein